MDHKESEHPTFFTTEEEQVVVAGKFISEIVKERRKTDWRAKGQRICHILLAEKKEKVFRQHCY